MGYRTKRWIAGDVIEWMQTEEGVMKRETRNLSGLMEVLAFTAGRTPTKDYSPFSEPEGIPKHIPGSRTASAVEFENGDILVCVAYDEGDYSEMTPGEGVQMEFYAITTRAS